MKKVVCIDNTQKSHNSCVQNLTLGKIYETEDDIRYSNVLGIINDKNLLIGYDSKRFISLKNYREKRINQLLKNN